MKQTVRTTPSSLWNLSRPISHQGGTALMAPPSPQQRGSARKISWLPGQDLTMTRESQRAPPIPDHFICITYNSLSMKLRVGGKSMGSTLQSWVLEIPQSRIVNFHKTLLMIKLRNCLKSLFMNHRREYLLCKANLKDCQSISIFSFTHVLFCFLLKMASNKLFYKN